MSDTSTPPEASGKSFVPPPPDAPRRTHTILGRLSTGVREQNWFAVGLEVLIVIVGVVVGFQVTGWGQVRAERAKERAYLHQLADDLRETERVFAESDSRARGVNRATGLLARAFYLETPPPRDSLIHWYDQASTMDRGRPVLGTIEALVSTGDLDLTRDDSLRSAIPPYLEGSRELVQAFGRSTDIWFAASDLLDSFFDRAEVFETSVPLALSDSLARAMPLWPIPPGGARRNLLPFEPAAFLSNREAQVAIDVMVAQKNNTGRIASEMRRSAATLQHHVERALER